MVKAREADPAFVGWTVLGTIRTDEFIDTRIVEAVVYGLDLAQALDRASTPSEPAVKRTAEVLDTLRRSQRNGTRPESLADDWLWVQVAAGRLLVFVGHAAYLWQSRNWRRAVVVWLVYWAGVVGIWIAAFGASAAFGDIATAD